MHNKFNNKIGPNIDTLMQLIRFNTYVNSMNKTKGTKF